jgi:hypothetical protein
MFNQILGIVALVALFILILLLGWTIKKYRGLKKELGKMVIEISPSKDRRRLVTIFVSLFIGILIGVAVIYSIQDADFNIASVLLLDFVIFNTSSYIKRMTQIHEKGILAYGEIIQFKDIRKYDFETRGKKVLFSMILPENREFKVFVEKKYQEAIKSALVKRIRY